MSNGSKEQLENLPSVESNRGDAKMSCNFCVEKQDKESLNENGLSPCPKQRISPTSSLTSSDSTISCCSDISVEAYSNGRDDQDGDSSDSSREDPNFRPNGHLQKLSSSIHENGIHQSNEQAKVKEKENGIASNSCTVLRLEELNRNVDNPEAKDNVVDSDRSDINGKLRYHILLWMVIYGNPQSQKTKRMRVVWSWHNVVSTWLFRT